MNTTVLDFAENFKTTFFFLRHSHVSQSGLGLFNPSIVPPPPMLRLQAHTMLSGS